MYENMWGKNTKQNIIYIYIIYIFTSSKPAPSIFIGSCLRSTSWSSAPAREAAQFLGRSVQDLIKDLYAGMPMDPCPSIPDSQLRSSDQVYGSLRLAVCYDWMSSCRSMSKSLSETDHLMKESPGKKRQVG